MQDKPADGVRYRRIMEDHHAVEAAASGCAFAAQRGWNVSVCVVDGGGHILALHRMTDAGPGTAEAAIAKARSAALFQLPTKLFDDLVADGRTGILTLPGSLPVQGGLPVMLGGDVVGAIAASGVQPHEDEEVAEKAMEALLASDG